VIYDRIRKSPPQITSLLSSDASPHLKIFTNDGVRVYDVLDERISTWEDAASIIFSALKISSGPITGHSRFSQTQPLMELFSTILHGRDIALSKPS
jgi:hypothetical protein